MSQQEFDPQQQAQKQDVAQDEVYYPRAPYSWSGKLEQEAAPRDEPPSVYGESRGRDQSGLYAAAQPGEQEQAYSGDDTHTYQRGYGPYSSYNYQGSTGAAGQAPGTGPTGGWGQSVPPGGWGQSIPPGDQGHRVPPGGWGQSVPPWARPQQHRRSPLRFGFILLVLVIVALVQGLITHGGMLMGAGGDILGAAIGLILFVLIVPLIILVIFSGLLRRMFRSAGSNNPARRQHWRGRSWPNGPYWW